MNPTVAENLPIMPLDHVDDPNDPRLEDFRDIRDRDLRGREGIFLGEQTLVVERMLQDPALLRRILVIDGRKAWLEEALRRHGDPDVECLVAPRALLEGIAGFDIHRGVLASGNRAKLDGRSIARVVPEHSKPATILCCQAINNIDNIGMLFRIAAAFGVDAMVLDPACHDPLYRKSLRVSIGHALRIPFVRSHDWLADIEDLRQSHGFTIVGSAISDHSSSLDTYALPQDTRRVAIVLGSEFDGLCEETRNACDEVLRIPMAPDVDSLNVAVAAAVLLDRLSQADRA